MRSLWLISLLAAVCAHVSEAHPLQQIYGKAKTSETMASERRQAPSLCAEGSSQCKYRLYMAHGIQTVETSATGDVLKAVHEALLHEGPGFHYIRVPPGNYMTNTRFFLGAQNLSHYVIDMRGAFISTETPGLVPFLTNSTVTDIHLIGGHFVPSNDGARFDSCLSGYSDPKHPLTSLEVAFEECAGTTMEGIAIYNPVVDSSARSCSNIHIHDVAIHDTGAQNINIDFCNNVEVSHNRLGNPGLNGPTATSGQAVNLQVAGSHADLHDNDIFGTPFWIRSPTSFNTPASGVYAWGEDIHVVRNNIHDSKCTDALCDQHGRTSNIGVVDRGRPFPFGGSAENYQGVDGIHLDTVSKAYVAENTIRGYSTGVTVEVSRNVTVSANIIEKSYRFALYDSSRYQFTAINALTSLDGLSAGPGVSLSLSKGCGKEPACVAATVRGDLVPGTVLLYQKSPESSPFDANNVFPQVKVSSSAPNVGDGVVSLVLSNTATCDRRSLSDQTSVVMPLHAMNAALSEPQQLAFDYGRMYFLHVGSRKGTDHKFVSWCLLATKHASLRDVTFRLSDLRFSLSSQTNHWISNHVASTGQFGVLASGCGDDTEFRRNIFTDVANGDYAYNSYGWMFTMFVGNADCRRSRVLFADNQAAPSSQVVRSLLSAGTTHVSAIALGGNASRLEQPFGTVTITGNAVTTEARPNSPLFVDSADPRGLHGIAPDLTERNNEFRPPRKP